jgi:ribonuclease HI
VCADDKSGYITSPRNEELRPYINPTTVKRKREHCENPNFNSNSNKPIGSRSRERLLKLRDNSKSYNNDRQLVNTNKNVSPGVSLRKINRIKRDRSNSNTNKSDDNKSTKYQKTDHINLKVPEHDKQNSHTTNRDQNDMNITTSIEKLIIPQLREKRKRSSPSPTESNVLNKKTKHCKPIISHTPKRKNISQPVPNKCNISHKESYIPNEAYIPLNITPTRLNPMITLYGLHNMRNKWNFISFCRQLKIPIDHSSILKTINCGYRSKFFDNRKIQIIFKCNKTSQYINQCLIEYSSSPHIICPKWRHKLSSYENTDDKNEHFISDNKFKILGETDFDKKCTDNIAVNEKRISNKLCKIGTWNVQSIQKKSGEITNFIIEHDIKILVTTETRWDGNNIELPNYLHWFGRKSTNKHDGIGFIIHSSIIEDKKIKVFNGTNINTLFILIEGRPNTRSTLLAGVYGPASPTRQQTDTWWEILQSDITSFNNSTNCLYDLILIGDFNARIGIPTNQTEKHIIGKYGENTRDIAGKNAVSFLKQNNLVCLNNRKLPLPNETNFTYHQQGKIQNKSIIDLIFISEGMLRHEYNTTVLQTTLTGKESHFPVITELRFTRKICKPRNKYSYYKWNPQKLKSMEVLSNFRKIRDRKIKDLDKNQSIGIKVKELTKAIVDAGDETIGKIHNIQRDRQGIYSSKQLKKHRNRIRDYKKEIIKMTARNCKRVDNDKLKHLKSKIYFEKSNHDKAKTKYLAKKLVSQSDNNETHKMYNTLKKFTDTSTNTQVKAVKDQLGNIQTDTENILNIFRDVWQKYYKRTQNHRLPPLKKTEHNNPLCNNKINYEEVKQSIKQLKLEKAAGIDNVIAEFIKEPSVELIHFLKIIFCEILESGTFPSDWKIDKRIPLFKKGSKIDPDNYRPIAIHSVFRKIYCNIIHNRLEKIVQLHPDQYGFQKDRRCSDHTAVLRNLIRKHFKQKSQGELFIAVFDFSKAYDSCDIQLLIKKLNEMGVSGLLLDTIQSLYTNAQSRVYLHGKYSKPFQLNRGVAQGCRLSTLLFNIYIDNLLHKLTLCNPQEDTLTEQFPLCYADDLILVSKSREVLETSIAIIQKWCSENYININTKKSGILTVNVPDDRKTFKINNIEIPILTSTKYLGFTIPENGSWEPHIQNKINIAYGMSKRYHKFLTCDSIPYKTRIQVADSIILSHLRYGEEIFSITNTLTQKIQSCENNIIKRRSVNFCRINRLKTLGLSKLFNDPRLSASDYLPGQTVKDINCISQSNRTRSKKFKIKPELFTNQDISLQKCKSSLKKFFYRQNITINQRRCRTNPNEALMMYNSIIPDLSILDNCGENFNSLIRWKLGFTKANILRPDTDFKSDYICPLCTEQILINIQNHMLTSCSETRQLHKDFSENIKKISSKIHKEYLSTPDALKPSWILTFGEKCSLQYSDKNGNIITEGESVSEGINKSNTMDKLKAIEEYNAIKLRLDQNILRIYTDGSKRDQQVGSGYAIFIGERLVDSRSRSLKNCENNAAELYAIFDALNNIGRFVANQQRQTVHIFTDSRYCIDTLSLHTKINKHHRIINLIYNLCSSLGITIELHWIPSHIEVHTPRETLKIHGNELADQLANRGSMNPNHIIDYRREYVEIPKSITIQVANFLENIDNKIYKSVGFYHPANAGPSNDDFSYTDAQQSSPCGGSVTS